MRTMVSFLVATLSSWIALTGAAQADDTASRCTPALNGRPLGTVNLFDGPVSDQADLAPDTPSKLRNDWAHLGTTGRPVFLVCHYAGVSEPQQFRLPPGVSRCTGILSRDGKSYRSFVCRP